MSVNIKTTDGLQKIASNVTITHSNWNETDTSKNSCILNKPNTLTTMEEINANTNEEALAGATAVKELNSSLSRKNITSSLGTFTCDGATVTTNSAYKFGNMIQMQLKIVPTSDWANDASLTITGLNYPSATTLSSQGLVLFTSMYSGGSISVRNTSGTTITAGTERYIDILYMTHINE